MKMALAVFDEVDVKRAAAFIHDNALDNASLVLWRLTGSATPADALLVALEAEFHQSAVDMIFFPASVEGDELATRLAWRLQGCAVCQILSCDADTVTKAVYGNALTATLRAERLPACFSLSRHLPARDTPLPDGLNVVQIDSLPQAGGLPPPEILNKSQHPLQTARVVLATGQGASGEAFARFAAELNAEIGFTRQRVMAGGCDEQRMLGISGQSVAPEICIIAGASGASAFMAGVQQSGLIVAVNTDSAAPVFAAADVGIVGDAQEVLSALVDCAN